MATPQWSPEKGAKIKEGDKVWLHDKWRREEVTGQVGTRSYNITIGGTGDEHFNYNKGLELVKVKCHGINKEDYTLVTFDLCNQLTCSGSDAHIHVHCIYGHKSPTSSAHMLYS